MDNNQFPKLIAFDLEYVRPLNLFAPVLLAMFAHPSPSYTLWDFWVDTHVEPPLKQDATTGAVYDSAYDPLRVEFYKDVPEILRGLKSRSEVTVTVASRTSATKLAREALRLITIPVLSSVEKDTTNVPDTHRVESHPAINFFDQLEIYPGSKIAHFKQFHKLTGIPYSEMLFFDDESRNKEVERELGVTFIWVRDGMNWECFQKGLSEWRKRHARDDNASN